MDYETVISLYEKMIELEQQLAAAHAREKARCETGNQYIIDNARLTEQLAAAHAREKVLRDALLELANLHVVIYSQSPEGRAYLKKLGDLMASTDDTALKAALAAERERCAKACDWYNDKLAARIRALGDE